MGGPNFSVTVTGTGNPGVAGTSTSGDGVAGTSTSGDGVRGTSTSGAGVHGSPSDEFRYGSIGVRGTSGSLAQPVVPYYGPSDGVRGECKNGVGVRGVSESTFGMYGENRVDGYAGVFGTSTGGIGVAGSSSNGDGVTGNSVDSQGVVGESSSNIGVFGIGHQNSGVLGRSRTGYGVFGTSSTPEGWGSGIGVYGHTDDNPNGVFRPTSGVWGHNANRGRGVYGDSVNGVGVYGQCRNPSRNVSDRRVGGLFDGGVIITNGIKPFTIDHPLDPENKYLVHTSVESSEMKNVYDGVAHLDEDGEAWVDLPEWFEALNGDFRYQLTAVGGSAPNLHVAEEISENRYKIAGGEGGMKVCWQVTGSRKDPWAAANPFEVEQEKSEEERGRYLDPSLYDAPEEQRVLVAPLAETVEEEHRRRIDESTRLAEEQRREMEELRRQMEERQEEAPPEST